jgi:hypothetical protein
MWRGSRFWHEKWAKGEETEEEEEEKEAAIPGRKFAIPGKARVGLDEIERERSLLIRGTRREWKFTKLQKTWASSFFSQLRSIKFEIIIKLS